MKLGAYYQPTPKFTKSMSAIESALGCEFTIERNPDTLGWSVSSEPGGSRFISEELMHIAPLNDQSLYASKDHAEVLWLMVAYLTSPDPEVPA